MEYQKPLTPEEAEKIVSAGLINETYMYVETAGGEVRIIENIEGTAIEEVDTIGTTILTTNGIRKKDNNCLIDKKGNVYTWGINDYGQLGDGTTEDSNVPICISDIEYSDLYGKNIVDIYGYGERVIAKDNDGKIYTWGGGYSENGAITKCYLPTCISETEDCDLYGKNITDIYINGNTVIARDDEGKVYTWGNNEDGQLGNESTEDSNVPICISDETILENKVINHIILDTHYGCEVGEYNHFIIFYITTEGQAYKVTWKIMIEAE